jgi:hypothetical protein
MNFAIRYFVYRSYKGGNNMKRLKFSFFLLFAVMITAPMAHAALTTPSDLSPGDKFHWVFVTSDGTSVDSTQISVYNNFVNNAANAAGTWTSEVGGNWKVIGSTQAVSAKSNIGASDYPIYDLNGNRVANNTADLWDGEIQSNIDVDENGVVYSGWVWTGTLANGNSDTAYYFGASNGNRRRGNSSSDLYEEWIWDIAVYKSYQYRLYAMSDVQTVVPIPGAVWLLGSGLVGLVGIRRKLRE